MKKKITAVFSLIAILLCSALNVFSQEEYFSLNDRLYTAKEGCPQPSAQASFLCEWKSGAVLHSHNADLRLPMASTTKIMTAILISELLPLDRMVTVTKEAAGTEGSSIYLYEGEKISVEDLLYALMLESANDAACALAIEAAGSVEAFADLMNQKADSMGLKDTHFTNPHGLDHQQHYTTASELAKIAAYALNDPIVSKIVSTKSYKTENRVMINHNRLLNSYEGAIGMKTGYTIKTGRCLVSAARRNGMTLIAVTLNCSNDWQGHKNLLNWGFENYARTVFAVPCQFEFSLAVTGGNKQEIRVTNPIGLDCLTDLPSGDITYEVKLKRLLFAPVVQGEYVGEIDFYYNGKYVSSLELSATESVEQIRKPQSFFQKIWQYLKNLLKL